MEKAMTSNGLQSHNVNYKKKKSYDNSLKNSLPLPRTLSKTNSLIPFDLEISPIKMNFYGLHIAYTFITLKRFSGL